MHVLDADTGIRDDVTDAIAEVVQRWHRPGDWWAGAEQLAMVKVSRTARAEVDQHPAWYAPSSDDRIDPSGGLLPAPIVDAVWRITNHPGTLTESWYASIIDRGVDPFAYVEMAVVVATAVCVDWFAQTLDLDAAPLGEAAVGEPRQPAREAKVDKHWVPTADVDAGGNVLKAFSAISDGEETRTTLTGPMYLPREALAGDMGFTRGTLSRQQMELVAARTAQNNECFY